MGWCVIMVKESCLKHNGPLFAHLIFINHVWYPARTDSSHTYFIMNNSKHRTEGIPSPNLDISNRHPTIRVQQLFVTVSIFFVEMDEGGLVSVNQLQNYGLAQSRCTIYTKKFSSKHCSQKRLLTFQTFPVFTFCLLHKFNRITLFRCIHFAYSD